MYITNYKSSIPRGITCSYSLKIDMTSNGCCFLLPSEFRQGTLYCLRKLFECRSTAFTV